MNTAQHISDDGDLRRYFSQIPHMADDDLDPYQYRLYGHYKRVCGATGGVCDEYTATTAKRAKMSMSKVKSTRQWLASNGWIDLKTEGGEGEQKILIRILDRWQENFNRYAPPLPENGEGVTKKRGGGHQKTPTPLPESYIRINKEEKGSKKENGGGNKSIAADNPSPVPSPTAAAVDNDSFIAINSALTAINKGLKKPFTGLPELTRILINNGKTVADVQALWRSCQNKQNPAGAFIHAIKNNLTPNTRPTATPTASTPKPKYRRNPTTGEIEEFVGTGWGKAYGVDEEVLSA